MSKTDVWMPLYPADLLADTSHLSREDFGSYVLLICAYWRRGSALPDDDQALRRICRCDMEHWPEARRVLADLFTVDAGTWTHKRIEAELEKARRNREIAVSRGKQGAVNRWKKHSPSNAPTIDGAEKNDGSSPSPSPISTKVDINTDRETGSAAVEPSLPPSFPKTEEDAVSRCMSAGIPDDFIKAAYQKALSRGGKDAKEIPIAYWAAYVKTEWKYELNRKEKEKHETRQSGSRPHVDRNAGTANAGKASQYAGLGKLATS